jgi:hypothetical protein
MGIKKSAGRTCLALGIVALGVMAGTGPAQAAPTGGIGFNEGETAGVSCQAGQYLAGFDMTSIPFMSGLRPYCVSMAKDGGWEGAGSINMDALLARAEPGQPVDIFCPRDFYAFGLTGHSHLHGVHELIQVSLTCRNPKTLATLTIGTAYPDGLSTTQWGSVQCSGDSVAAALFGRIFVMNRYDHILQLGLNCALTKPAISQAAIAAAVVHQSFRPQLETRRATPRPIGAKAVASVQGTSAVRMAASTLSTGSAAAPNFSQPAILYGIGADGILRWYRHNGAATGVAAGVPGAWADAKNVNHGWDSFKQVFSGGGGVIYGITRDGKLIWSRHTAYLSGLGVEVAGAWDESREVSEGWGGYRQVFSGGGGIIYAITQDGQLLWFKHSGFANGSAEWEGPAPVAMGFGNYQQVFAGGNGVIYAIGADGILKWNRHLGYLNGAGDWAGVKDVGRGWDGLREVFSVGSGIIYAISQDGTLRWYKHVGYLDGRGMESPGAWQGRIEVGRGWHSFTRVIAQY